MKKQGFTAYSRYLDRPMTWMAVGHGGKLMLAFPSQNGRYYDYDNFGMTGALAQWIEAGQLTVICPDTTDRESWSATELPAQKRAENMERWYNHIMREVIPAARRQFPDAPEKMLITGCSMGGGHAASIFFRHPELFDGVISLSSCYRAGWHFGDYMDEMLFSISPFDSVPHIPADDPRRKAIAEAKVVLCVGQGQSEEAEGLLPETRRFEQVLKDAGIKAWVDYWGYDVEHDWYWWRKMIRYFMDTVYPYVEPVPEEPVQEADKAADTEKPAKTAEPKAETAE